KNLLRLKEDSPQRHKGHKGKSRQKIVLRSVALRSSLFPLCPLCLCGESSFYFTTLTLSFASWVIGTVPLYIAVATTLRFARLPGAASAATLTFNLASSCPAGMVTSSIVTPLASGGSTTLTLNSPSKSYIRVTLTTTSVSAPTFAVGLALGSTTVASALGSTVSVTGVDGSTTLVGCFGPLGIFSIGICADVRSTMLYCPGGTFAGTTTLRVPSVLSGVMVIGWLLLTVKPCGSSPGVAWTSSGVLKSAWMRLTFTLTAVFVPCGT